METGKDKDKSSQANSIIFTNNVFSFVYTKWDNETPMFSIYLFQRWLTSICAATIVVENV